MINVALVDIYLARRRIRAEIPTKGFSRVSDLLNNAQSEFLSGALRVGGEKPAEGASDPPSATSELVIRRSEIRMIRPIEEPAAGPPAPADHRARLRVNVICEMDDWQVGGVLHLMDQIAWVDFLSAMRDRFLPFTNATIRSAEGAGSDHQFILVNAARISALYEAPQQ